MIDINALAEALMPYGYSDITCTYPRAYLPKKTAERLMCVGIRMMFAYNDDDAKTMRRNLIGKYEGVWDLLTGPRFGLRLQDYPTFEIRGQLMYHCGSDQPTPAQVYAEATYDCWVS